VLVIDVPRYIWYHPSNRGSRLRHLAQGIRFQLRGRLLRRRTIVPIGQRSRIYAELHRTASSRAAYANPPDTEMRVWMRWLRAGDLFVDVGANVGIYSIVAAEAGARVIAVEPDPETRHRITENAELNHYDVSLLAGALSDQPGVGAFTVGLDCVNHLAEASNGQTRQVTVYTLDDLLGSGRARGVKIDVEGAEDLVIRGAEHALTEHRIDLLQVEWAAVGGRTDHPQRSVARALEAHGYRLWHDDGAGRLMPLTDWAWPRDIFACVAPPPELTAP
jgi:FkbM family methyltransferase